MRKIFIIGLGCMLALLVGYTAYLSYSKSKESRLMNMSRGFVAHAELQNARLSLSEVLRINPRNVEATRMMAELVAGDSEADELQWRMRVTELAPGSAHDRIALAMAAAKAGDLALATNSLAQVALVDRKTASYQNAVGVLAIAERQPLLAEASFEAAASLDPTSGVPQLNLAVLRLHSTNGTSVTQAREELTALAQGADASYHCQALRELIADAYVHGHLNSALALCHRLLAETNSQFSDRILQLDVLQKTRGPELMTALAEARTAAGVNPLRIESLAGWEMKSVSPAETLGWFASLPASTQTNQPVAMFAAECRVARRDWPGLDATLRGQNWGALEFVRHALRARACYGEQMLDDRKAEWDQALQTAGEGMRNLTVLLQLCTQWSWQVEETDLLSTMFKNHPEEKWVEPLLIRELAASGRTRAMMNVFQQQCDQDPSDLQAKNNLAMTAMLLNAAEVHPFDLAVQNYQAQPTNITFASTYAFALYQQKKWAEALSVFAAFDARTLSQPDVAGYYAIVLQANGHAKLAKQYLAIALRAPGLLPEERNLFVIKP